jgi:pyrroline-5-carboxylate reductase
LLPQPNNIPLNSFDVVAPNNYLNLKKEFDIQTFSSMSEALNKTKYDLIIFAIKPQIFKNVIIEFKNYSRFKIF